MNQEKSKEGFSRDFLSKKDRVSVWSKVLVHPVQPPTPFTAAGLSRELQIPYESVRREFVLLESYGFIEQFEDSLYTYPSPSDAMITHYTRTDTEFWDAARVMIDFANKSFVED